MNEARADVTRLVGQAIALRVVLAIVIHFSLPESFFAPDQGTYSFVGQRLAAWWSGDSALYPARFLERAAPVGYYYIVATLYFVFGSWPLLPKLLNAVVSGLSIWLVYRLAQTVIGDDTRAVWATRVTAFMPSMVLWSVLNIRDAWVILILLVACNAALDLLASFRVGSLALLGASLLGLLQFRAYLVYMVALSVAGAWLLQRKHGTLRNLTMGLVLLAVLAATDTPLAPGRLQTADLETLQEIREATAMGGETNFAADADISTPGRALAFLPLGVAFFLFAPFPWMISGLRQAITLPEMLFLYSLVPSMLQGLRRLLRERWSESLAMVLVAGGLTLGYGLGQANAGTAYRHRAQVLPFLMIFAAAGRKDPAAVAYTERNK